MRFPSAVISLLLLTSLIACENEPDPQAIVDRAIEAHGGRHLDDLIIDFDFRGRHFRITLDDGHFQYERKWQDSTGHYRDVLNNDGVFREIDGRPVELTPALRRSIESGVNSVSYFVLLPFRLNDAAVQKRYLGTATVKGQPYEKIEVTFRKNGGGRDYEDRFVYWFHREHHTMDYLAYGFHVDDGGTRFREAVNTRIVDGIRFDDHVNYTSPLLPDPNDPIESYDSLFASGGLEHVSNIKLENVRVESLRP